MKLHFVLAGNLALLVASFKELIMASSMACGLASRLVLGQTGVNVPVL